MKSGFMGFSTQFFLRWFVNCFFLWFGWHYVFRTCGLPARNVQMETNEHMRMSDQESFLVHRFRGYKLPKDPICCISSDFKSQRAAVARSSGCVEIWSTADWFLEGIVPASECGTVECVLWCNGRLFAANLNGFVLELDVRLLVCKRKLALNGGAVMCMDVNGTQLVLGTIDGLVTIVETCDEQLAADCLTIQRSFPRQKHGVIGIASYAEQKSSSSTTRQRGESQPVWLIATGHADAVYIWDANRSLMLRRIAFEREPVRRVNMRTRPNFVRCVRFVDASTLVTGDSLGMVTFWDVSFGTQLKTFRASRAEILSLTVSTASKGYSTSHQQASLAATGCGADLSVFASGVESRVTHFVRVRAQRAAQVGPLDGQRFKLVDEVNEQKGDDEWDWAVGESLRGPHTHAVRALSALSGVGDHAVLLSGGLDGRLVAWRCDDASRPSPWRGGKAVSGGMVERLLDPVHHRAHVSVASDARIIMLQYADRLELSRLSSSGACDTQGLTQLARIEVGTSSRHEATRTITRKVGNLVERVCVRHAEPPTVVCSTISSDSRWIVYARSNQKLTVLRFVELERHGETNSAFSFKRARRIERALLTADAGELTKYVSVLRVAHTPQIDPSEQYLFIGTRRGSLIRLKLTPHDEEDDSEDDEQSSTEKTCVETRSLLFESEDNRSQPVTDSEGRSCGAAVLSIAVANDGTRLLVACSDRSLRLVDTERFIQLGVLRHDDLARRPVAFAFDDVGSAASTETSSTQRTLVLYSDGALTEFLWRPLNQSQPESDCSELVATETRWGRRVSRRARKRSALLAKLLRASASAYNSAQNADSRIAIWPNAALSDSQAARAEPVVFYQTNDELVYFGKSRLFDLCASTKKRKHNTSTGEPEPDVSAKRCKLNEHNVLHVSRQYTNVLFAKLIDTGRQDQPKELVLVEGLSDTAEELPPAFSAKKFGM